MKLFLVKLNILNKRVKSIQNLNNLSLSEYVHISLYDDMFHAILVLFQLLFFFKFI